MSSHSFTCKRVSAIALALLFAVPAARAAAIVVFSDFGSGGSFNTTVGYPIGSVGGHNLAAADQFTPSTGGNLSSITLALGYVSGPGSVEVSVAADSTGHPGATLTSETATVSGAFGGTNTVTLNSFAPPLSLTGGTPYWLLVSAASGTFEFNFNNIGSHGPHGTSFNGGSSFFVAPVTHGAFSVSVIPEPATFTILGAGILGMLGYNLGRKRRR